MPLKPHPLLWPAISTRAFPFSATSCVLCAKNQIHSPRFPIPHFRFGFHRLLHPLFFLLSFSSQRRCIPSACGSCYGRPFGGRDGTMPVGGRKRPPFSRTPLQAHAIAYL